MLALVLVTEVSSIIKAIADKTAREQHVCSFPQNGGWESFRCCQKDNSFVEQLPDCLDSLGPSQL